MQTMSKQQFSDSNSTDRFINFAGRDTHHSQFNRLTVGQIIHSLQRDIEPFRGDINCQDINGFTVPARRGVSECPACAAIGGVPAGNSRGASNVGEVREVAEGGVLIYKTICAVGAGDGVERRRG